MYRHVSFSLKGGTNTNSTTSTTSSSNTNSNNGNSGTSETSNRSRNNKMMAGQHGHYDALSGMMHANQRPVLQPEDFLEKTLSEYLGCHPTYMLPLIRAHNFILRESGPLSYPMRHYIAIMAAARHKCTFLINLSKKEFLFHGGNPEWLKGLKFAPNKVQALNVINKLLAHQPWLLTANHFESLIRNGSGGWTLSEMSQIIVLLAHFHTLCSLAFGCKFGFGEPEKFSEEEGDYEEIEIEELRYDATVNGMARFTKIIRRTPASKLIIERCRQLEIETAELTRRLAGVPSSESSTSVLNSTNQVNTSNHTIKLTKAEKKQMRKERRLAQRALKNKDQQSDNSENKIDINDTDSAKQSCTKTLHTPTSSTSKNEISSTSITVETNNSLTTDLSNNTDETAKQQQHNIATTKEEDEEVEIGENGFKVNTWSKRQWAKNNYDVFLEDADFVHVDFAQRSRQSEVSTFRYQDYQWEDQGYSLCNWLYPDSAQHVDEKFKVGYNLTYYTLGPKINVDTSPFRRAIWNYIQCIYGMRHDDYNYREVNILLERTLKCYIRCLGCNPEDVVKIDDVEVMRGFRASEKIHVIIMVTEARLQVELLYALRALTEYIKKNDK